MNEAAVSLNCRRS